MLKIISPTGWNFGQPICQSVKKTAAGRLVGQDYQDLVKRAGAEFAHRVKQSDLLPGEHPLHVIAMGATESYGNNRNGDGWKAAMLRRCHPTFVKFSKFYRHHRHNDPSKSYGRVIASEFNEPMQRVELLIGLNGTKQAAERNGGLVADEELEKLARDEDLSVSMAASVPHDICASCGNKARNRSEYCDESSCVSPDGIKRGGCKRYLAKVAFDGFINHVDNPDGRFFDISMVTVPADPIAYGNTADYLVKAASGQATYGGAELAEALGLIEPLPLRLQGVRSTHLQRQIKAAYRLADIETNFSAEDARYLPAVKTAQSRLPVTELGPLGSPRFQRSLAKLAQLNICLTPAEFLQAIEEEVPGGISTKTAHDFYQALPGSFSRLLALSGLDSLMAGNAFAVPADYQEVKTAGFQEYLPDSSLHPAAVERRLVQAAVRREPSADSWRTKMASAVNPRADALTKLYALYKVSHLAAQPDDQQEFTARLLVCQNVSS